jgi:hypothetical protein
MNDIDKGKSPGQVAPATGGKRSRRGFLIGAGAVAGVAGVAAVALKNGAQPVTEVAAPEPDKAPAQSRGYHETAHIRRYYETTKV